MKPEYYTDLKALSLYKEFQTFKKFLEDEINNITRTFVMGDEKEDVLRLRIRVKEVVRIKHLVDNSLKEYEDANNKK